MAKTIQTTKVAEKRNCCGTQVFRCSFLNASFIVMNISNNVSCNRCRDGVVVIDHASHLCDHCVCAKFHSISTQLEGFLLVNSGFLASQN